MLAATPGASVVAVGISGQMHSSVFLDAHGEVIRPALLWCDGRTTAECREITERVGGEARLRDLASNPALEGFTLPKVLWLRNHEPEAFARLSTVLLAKDFVRYRLTGALATEPSDASATLMYDTARLRWSWEILDAVGLPHSIVPPVGGSSDVLGRVTLEASGLTGIPHETPVVGGGADNACGAAGVGAVAPGEAVTSWGTSGTVLAPLARAAGRSRSCARTRSVMSRRTRGISWASCSRREAPLRGIAISSRATSSPPAKRTNDSMPKRRRVAPGAEGVTFLPYLQGERTPHRDASLRGAFVGLSLAHTRAHMTRAVIEGICFALRDSLSILQALDVAPNRMLLTGGGARSHVRATHAVRDLWAARVDRQSRGRVRRTAPRCSRRSARRHSPILELPRERPCSVVRARRPRHRRMPRTMSRIGASAMLFMRRVHRALARVRVLLALRRGCMRSPRSDRNE